MIPRAYITEWRGTVPWADDAKVEQDLALTRALVDIFKESMVRDRLVLRGGTALHRILLLPPSRYSEDIDLVQRNAGPIGEVVDAVRLRLDPWLGEPRRDRGPGGIKIVYRFVSETLPAQPLRLKIEINTREHFTVLALRKQNVAVHSPWFRGDAEVPIYAVDELLGTKLRALYQRKKGRDLFDLWLAFDQGLLDAATVVDCFQRYMAAGGAAVSRAEFEANLAKKAGDRAFHEDVRPLLAMGVSYDPLIALEVVERELLARLPGEPWKGGDVIEGLG